jgi:hypothetical protein
MKKLTKPSGSSLSCTECGGRYRVEANETTYHVTDDGERDWDKDRDHVPYGDERSETVLGRHGPLENRTRPPN